MSKKCWLVMFCLTTLLIGIASNAFAQTETYTWTPTFTLTGTLTGSPTWTRTPTATRTNTNTRTRTGTATRTNTFTMTPTPTLTRTYTYTISITPTPTFTRSRTFTPTTTRTNTGSITITPTHTNTYTFTNTYTYTPTYPVGTITATWTPSFTRTPTLPVATPTPTHTVASTVVLNCSVNENFEDGDLVTPFGGEWTALTWGTGASASVSITSPGSAGTTWGLYVVGGNPDASSGWGAEGGLNYGQVPVDLSAQFAGISFYVQASSPVTFRVQLKSAAGDGSSDYGADFTIGTGWQMISIPKSQWTSALGSAIDFNTALTQAQAFQWRSTGTSIGANLLLDEICVGRIPATTTPTHTLTPTPWASPPALATVTPYVWQAPATQVASVTGVSENVVIEARSYQLNSYLTLVIIRLTVHCGCTTAHIMRLRQNMGWDDIADYFGVPWTTIVQEVQADLSALPPETEPPANDVRGAANFPDDVPAVLPPRPIPTMTVVLPLPVYGEVCP